MAIIDTRRPKQSKGNRRGQNIQLGLQAANTGMNLADMIARIQGNRARVDALREQAKLENNVSWYNKFLSNREKTISMFSEAIENAGKKYGYGSEQQKKVRAIATNYINVINSKIGGTDTAEQIGLKMERNGQRQQTGGHDTNAITDNAQRAAIAESERKAKLSYEQAGAFVGDVNFNAAAELDALDLGPLARVDPNSQLTKQQVIANELARDQFNASRQDKNQETYENFYKSDKEGKVTLDPYSVSAAMQAGVPVGRGQISRAGRDFAGKGMGLAGESFQPHVTSGGNTFENPTITPHESGATTTGPNDVLGRLNTLKDLLGQ